MGSMVEEHTGPAVAIAGCRVLLPTVVSEVVVDAAVLPCTHKLLVTLVGRIRLARQELDGPQVFQIESFAVWCNAF